MNEMLTRAIPLLAGVLVLGIAIWIAAEMQPGDSSELTNEQVRSHRFLQCMDGDEYFPPHLVDKGKQILIRLSQRIEQQRPADNESLYRLTHAATDEFNVLAEEFYEAESEIETAARECIGADFYFIAEAYGFQDADVEELIATREW